MSNQLTAMAHDLYRLKAEKDRLEEELKSVNKQITKLSDTDIPEYMDENEIEKISVEGVGTLFLTTKIYANVKSENKEAFYDWLRETGNGALVQEYVFPASLKAFAKEQLGEGKPLPEILDARLYQSATLRRK